MTRFSLYTLFTSVLVISAVNLFAPVAHAALTCPAGCSEQIIDGVTACVDSANGFCDTPGVGTATQVQAQAAAAGTRAASLNEAAAKQPTDPKFGALIDSALASIMNWIMMMFAWLLGIAMVTLDNSVYYTVVKMGAYVHNLSAIGVAWQILRDVGNIALIFGFLAVGITTILDVDWYGGGTKFLPGLIIAAVFLNFSLFMTEAVIDAGNLFATQFYTQINGGTPAGAGYTAQANGTVTGTVISNVGGAASAVKNEAISSKLMHALKLQKIYGDVLKKKDLLSGTNIIFIGLMGTGLFIVASFVMFSLAFILIARFIALIFLIILAPVGFAGLAIPMLKKQAQKWWDTLFEQTITAPILLLLLYIALRVITDAQFLNFSGATPDYLGFIPTEDNKSYQLPNLASAILTFAIAMGLLLAVTLSAKKLSAFGSSWATSTAGKLSFGAAAWGARSTVGWGLQRFSESNAMRRFSRVPIAGRAVSGALSAAAKGSFDVRGTSALRNFPGGAIDAGAAQKGGFRQWEEDKVKARQKYAKDLEQTDKEKKEEKLAKNRLENAQAADKAYSTTDTRNELEEAKKALNNLKTKPQTTYAERLTWGPGKWFKRNEKAAKKILKEAKESEDEKALAAIKKAISKGTEEEEKPKKEEKEGQKEEKSEEKK